MNLKQYTRQKRRNPLILVLSIGLTLFLVVTMIKHLGASKNETESSTQIVLTTNFKSLPDSLFPIFLMKDKEVIKIFTSQVPKDTAFMWNLTDRKNYFELMDKHYNVISKDSAFYHNETVIFVNLQQN